MPIRSHRVLMSALLIACAFTARAENLQDLYQAGLAYDATFLSARASLDAAQYRRDQAYALRRPSIGLNASAGRSTSNTPDALSTQSTYSNQVGATISGQQSLFNRANDKTIAQAEKAFDAARADFSIAEQDLIIRISQAYFDVLAAQDTLATARSSLTAISEQVASAKRNFEVGTANITDTREAQARYDLARANEIVADNDLTNKRIALDQLVGRTNVQPNRLATPVTLPPITPSAVEEWAARADAEHPQVRKARLALDVARLETEKARAGHLPTVALSASVGKGRLWVAGESAPIAFDYRTPSTTSSIALTMSVPLYAGDSIQNRVKETVALETKSEDDLASARRSIDQATRTAFYGVRSGAAQVAALEAAESSSQLALDSTLLGYKVGVRVNIDVLNAQAQLYDTQAKLAQARYNVVMAGLRLRQAAGQLNADDVGAVNRLIQP